MAWQVGARELEDAFRETVDPARAAARFVAPALWLAGFSEGPWSGGVRLVDQRIAGAGPVKTLSRISSSRAWRFGVLPSASARRRSPPTSACGTASLLLVALGAVI
jgi:hypothetical protein